MFENARVDLLLFYDDHEPAVGSSPIYRLEQQKQNVREF
jgi:hypothetical protein